MKVPLSQRTKALFVIDVQPEFLDQRSQYIVGNILKLLQTSTYEQYVVATFYAEAGSLWDVQQRWTCPRSETVPDVVRALVSKNPIHVEKQTRSVFRGNADLRSPLEERGIQEVHLVGTQTNDCILATALDSFDTGFVPYVIEECCEGPTKELHDAGLQLLRRQNMTNNSCIEDIDYLTI